MEIVERVKSDNLSTEFINLNNREYNIRLSNGKLLCKKWCSYIMKYYNTPELYKVYKGIECNIFNSKTEQFISKKWFEGTSVFCHGFCVVVINNKYNYYTLNGTYLLKKWADFASDFEKNCFISKYNNSNFKVTGWIIYNGFNYEVDENGNIIYTSRIV